MEYYKSNYIKWLRLMIIVDTSGMILWISLASFIILTKNAIGINNIPIFEMLVFLTGLIGVYLAHHKISTLKGSIFYQNTTEIVFNIAVLSILISTGDLTVSGWFIYCIIISNEIAHQITSESIRSYEDNYINTASGKRLLKKLRKRRETSLVVGGAVGSVLGVIALTWLKIDIIDYAIVILSLNIMQNTYSHLLWVKYL